MPAEVNCSPPFVILESRYTANQDGSPLDGEDPESLEDMKHMKHGKPPRHLSELYLGSPDLTSPLDGKSEFLPVFRSGSCSEIGPKSYMEGEHVWIDNLVHYLGAPGGFPAPGAFYGVFDGHGGIDAATFVQKNFLKFILDDSHFPTSVEKAIRNAFARADHALADSRSLDNSSGTTALTALIFGRTMLIANAGDCRAVLGKRGRAVELSRDHKPNCNTERLRIEKLGGIIYERIPERPAFRSPGPW